MRFCIHVKWKTLVVILWAPVCSLAQIRPFVVQDFTYDWGRPLAQVEDKHGETSLASTTDSSGSDDQSKAISPFVGVQHHERAANRFQWKPALAQYWFEISIQHAWRFAHEAGTRDAIEYGPFTHKRLVSACAESDGLASQHESWERLEKGGAFW